MSRVRSVCEVACPVLAVAAATVGLHALGTVAGFAFDWQAPADWLQRADPEEAVAGLLRATGLLCCYWILGSSVIYALASLKGKAPRLVRLVTLPTVRRIVDRAVAAALAASLAPISLSPALAATALPPAGLVEEPPPPVVFEIHHDGIPLPHLRLNTSAPQEPATVIVPTRRPQDTMPGATPRVVSTPPVTTPANEASPIPYTVVHGDNLWRIAKDRLRGRTTQEITAVDVAEYWRRLIAANRHSLRSGDPNLIYPGEILQLPAVEVHP